MDFNIVTRPETLVAGKVLRSPALAIEGPRLVKVIETWNHMLARDLPGPPMAAYVDYALELDAYLTHIIGYHCRTLDDLQSGDVLVRIPAGRYARFVLSGDDLSDVGPRLWRSVWDAEAEGRIQRVYTGDVERYPDTHTIEAFVAVSGDE